MSEYMQVDAASVESARRSGKSASAFRTISEVARELDVPQHVLRFWESKFAQVKPLKRGGGRRYYRPEDVELLRTIRALLYQEGYTIKGVQKLLREGQVNRAGESPAAAGKAAANGSVSRAAAAPGTVSAGTSGAGLPASARREIEQVIGELTELRRLLRG